MPFAVIATLHVKEGKTKDVVSVITPELLAKVRAEDGCVFYVPCTDQAVNNPVH